MARTPELLSLAPHQAETDQLPKAWVEGLESGPFAAFDIEEIKQKARARLASYPGPEQR